MNTRRFKDAITAQSATNPIGLTNSLLNSLSDLNQAGAGTDAIKDDPACRLLCYHISTLFAVDNMSDDLYSTLTNECREQQELAQNLSGAPK